MTSNDILPSTPPTTTRPAPIKAGGSSTSSPSVPHHGLRCTPKALSWAQGPGGLLEPCDGVPGRPAAPAALPVSRSALLWLVPAGPRLHLPAGESGTRGSGALSSFGLPVKGASSHAGGSAQMGGLKKRERSSRGGGPKRLLLLLPRASSSGFLPPAKRPHPRPCPGLRRLLSAAIPARLAGAASGHGARLSRAKRRLVPQPRIAAGFGVAAARLAAGGRGAPLGQGRPAGLFCTRRPQSAAAAPRAGSGCPSAGRRKAGPGRAGSAAFGSQAGRGASAGSPQRGHPALERCNRASLRSPDRAGGLCSGAQPLAGSPARTGAGSGRGSIEPGLPPRSRFCLCFLFLAGPSGGDGPAS